jgi:hypothetical protein
MVHKVGCVPPPSGGHQLSPAVLEILVIITFAAPGWSLANFLIFK